MVVLRSTAFARPPAMRTLHTSRPFAYAAGKDPQVSQGLTGTGEHTHKDPMGQSAKSGQEAARDKDAHHVDSATHAQKHADRDGLSGNKEKIGLADQVGSPDAGKSPGEGNGGEEPSTAWGSIKSKLGLGDTKRGYHTSAASMAPAGASIKEKASDASREASKQTNQVQEKTHGEQTEHLKHKQPGGPEDPKAGNSADQPELPSHREGAQNT